MPGTRKWYLLHTTTGYEKRVKANLQTMIETKGLENNVFEIEVPTETVVEIRDDGRRVERERVNNPGYVLVRMILDDRTQSIVRHTPGVTGFVGAGGIPAPLTREEYNKMTKRAPADAPRRAITNLEVGQAVRVTNGPLENFDGKISEVMADAGKVKVMVSIFGRETSVELDFDQVTRI